MKTPKSFAVLYKQGKVVLPIPDAVRRISVELSEVKPKLEALEILPDKNEIQEQLIESYRQIVSLLTEREMHVIRKIKAPAMSFIKALKLDKKTAANIYVALYEFAQALHIERMISLRSIAKNALEEKKVEAIKKRYTVMLLENSLRTGCLSQQAVEVIKDELERLKKPASEYPQKKDYHPLDNLELWAIIKQSPHAIEGEAEKIQRANKIAEMINTPLRVETGRPSKFFLKALQVVVYLYLHEDAGIPKEKAKQKTSHIINEYLKRKGLSDRATLKPKDVDNAVHS